MPSLLILERKQKRFLNPFQIPIFLFLFYLFGIEPINTFMHSRKFVQNHTRFQTKMGKVYTHFQTLGEAHTYMAYTREYPLGFYFSKLSPLTPLQKGLNLALRLSPLFALYRLPLWTPFSIPTAQFCCFNSCYNGHQSTHFNP